MVKRFEIMTKSSQTRERSKALNVENTRRMSSRVMIAGTAIKSRSSTPTRHITRKPISQKNIPCRRVDIKRKNTNGDLSMRGKTIITKPRIEINTKRSLAPALPENPPVVSKKQRIMMIGKNHFGRMTIHVDPAPVISKRTPYEKDNPIRKVVRKTKSTRFAVNQSILGQMPTPQRAVRVTTKKSSSGIFDAENTKWVEGETHTLQDESHLNDEDNSSV